MSLTVLQGAVEQGFIYSLVALGLYLSYRTLDVADLTTDGSFTLGAACSAILTIGGHPVQGLLLALDRLGVRPEHALFCGDTVMDAGAARGAGTHFAAVLGGTTPAEAFDRFSPDHISPDLWDLARWLGL